MIAKRKYRNRNKGKKSLEKTAEKQKGMRQRNEDARGSERHEKNEEGDSWHSPLAGACGSVWGRLQQHHTMPHYQPSLALASNSSFLLTNFDQVFTSLSNILCPLLSFPHTNLVFIFGLYIHSI